MFVAGIVVVGIIGGAAAHGDYSDYDDSHSQYGDASVKLQIREAEAQLQQAESEVKRLRANVQEQFEQCVDDVRNEFGLQEDDFKEIKSHSQRYISKPFELKQDMTNILKIKLEKSMAADRKNLKNIDDMIKKINDMTLYDE